MYLTVLQNSAIKYCSLKLNDSVHEAKIVVADLKGKMIVQKTILQSDDKVNTSLLNQIGYLVNVSFKIENEVRRFVKLGENKIIPRIYDEAGLILVPVLLYNI